jgi:hypothetical protein
MLHIIHLRMMAISLQPRTSLLSDGRLRFIMQTRYDPAADHLRVAA